MADEKITALSDGSPVAAGDEFVIARSGNNYKIPATAILARLFDSILGVDTNAIDTGAAGVPSGWSDLLVRAVLRTDDASFRGLVTFTLNNDSGANYDRQFVDGASTSLAAGTSLAGSGFTIFAHGSGGSASYPSVVQILIPSYTATTFNKVGILQSVFPDATAADNNAELDGFGWRSTAAISRLAVAAAAGQKLKAGSRLTIYGLP